MVQIYRAKTEGSEDYYVDLAGPYHIDDARKARLFDFLQKVCGDDAQLIERAVPPRTFGEKEGGETREWTAKDYLGLLRAKSALEARYELNRTEMSIDMKMGSFVPSFLKWFREQGLNRDPTEADIDAYWKAREDGKSEEE